MKFIVKNFGPIDIFEYDLNKDLIITFGSNNIGKSYSMSALYLFLKPVIKLSKLLKVRSGRLFNSGFDFRILSVDIKELKLSKIKVVDISDNINRLSIGYLNEILSSEWESSFVNTYGQLSNLSNSLNGSKKANVNLVGVDFSIGVEINDNIEICEYLTKRCYKAKLTEKVKSIRRNDTTHLQFDLSKLSDSNVLLADIVMENVMFFLNEIHREVRDMYFLPASRSGIYSGMSAFSQIVAQLSKNRSILSRGIELPGLSEPVADYFLSLSEIGTNRASIRREDVEEYKSPRSISKDVEKEILGGIVEFDKDLGQIIYRPKGLDRKFEMNNVSSMVSEISPVVAYLKYLIRSNIEPNSSKAILFIEEPEAHLHPEVQVKLIEILSQVIDSNIKLIMTSHSNYIFNKLNNLVMSENIDYKRYEPIHLQNGEKGSVGKFMEIDELGVYDSNFIRVTEEIFDEREEIIFEINERSNDD